MAILAAMAGAETAMLRPPSSSMTVDTLQALWPYVRVARSITRATQSHRFEGDDAGECRAVLVTATDPARGTERWWATMRQAYGGGGGGGRASQVYRASSDYSATQGFRQWSYLASTGQPMTFNAATGWWSGPEGWCLISTDRAHPGRTVGVIGRWTAPAAGSIRTTGSARDVHDVDNNGVKVSILKNESLLWSTAIANGNFPGTGFDLTTSVAPGDQIDFVVDSLGNDYWDMTALDPTITFTAN